MTSDFKKVPTMKLDEDIVLHWDDKTQSFLFSDYRILFDLEQGCCEIKGVLLKRKNSTLINIKTKSRNFNLGKIKNAKLGYGKYNIAVEKKDWDLPPKKAKISKTKNFDEEGNELKTFSIDFDKKTSLIFFNIHSGWYPNEFKIYKTTNGKEKLIFKSFI